MSITANGKYKASAIDKENMTDQQFCKIESALTGEPMDKVEQLVSKTFTGRELKEYLEEAFALYNVVKRFKIDAEYKCRITGKWIDIEYEINKDKRIDAFNSFKEEYPNSRNIEIYEI